VNALHRYRDAVLGNVSGKVGRTVVRGAALFPLGVSNSDSYKTRRLWLALGEVGIGAIPFLPTNEAYVSDWIDELLATPSEDLAVPGPPFFALEHKRKIERD
jgi:hypothetical protein